MKKTHPAATNDIQPPTLPPTEPGHAGFVRFPQGGEPAAARPFHRKSLDLLEERATADPSNLETKAALATTLYYDATCALHAGLSREAAGEFQRCLDIRKTLVTEPNAKMPQVELMLALARCGDHVEASRIAESLVATPPQNEMFYFYAACGYALASGCVTNNPGLARHYIDCAIDCLRKGKKAGWKDSGTLRIDPDLEPIRKNPEFHALIEQFRKSAEKKP